MRISFFLLTFLCLAHYCFSQSSRVDVYNNYEFACDTESGRLSINLCSGVKAEFVDSLMNKVYKEILKSIDKEITTNSLILKNKKSHLIDSAKIQFSFQQKNYYTRMKQSVINSQKQWIKLRKLVCDVEAIFCEGGTGCVAIINEAYINETLERIKRLESLGF